MRSNRARTLIVALATCVLTLVAVSSAFAVADLTSTSRAISAADGSLTISVVSAAGNNAAIHGNYNYWTSPVDPSGNFEWFNKSVDITDFAFPDGGNGAPAFQTATFGRNIGAGYSLPAALSGPPYTLADDGVYSIVATGTDSVLGDVRGEITPAFGIDQTKPTVTSNVLPFYAGNPAVTVTATDTMSGIENLVVDVDMAHDVSWEPSPLDPANFSVDFSFLGEGVHTFNWTAFDNAGNLTKGAATFAIDNTPPATTSDSVPVYDGAATIKLTATDVGGSGVAHTYYILDGAPQVEGKTIVVPAPVNGATVHTLEFWSVDAVGNIETPHVTTSFTVNSRHTITVTQSSHGTIAPVGAVIVNLGASKTFSITPALGYHVADVKVDGVSKGAQPSWTFSNVTANHTIMATFAINAKAVSTATVHASATSVLYGQTVRLFGAVAPNGSGQTVTIQRRIGSGAWANMATATLGSASTYTRTISKMSRGTWSFRVVYAGTSTVAASTSPAAVVVVR